MQIDPTIFILGIYYFLRILSLLIVARVIISWVAPRSMHPVVVFVVQTTEHVVAPIRNRLPRGSGALGMVDWSPLIALILIDLLRYLLISLFS